MELVQIVEWCLTTQFVAVPLDTQEIPWNLAGFHPLLNPLILIPVILTPVDPTVRNMNKKDIVSVLVYQDTEESHPIANLNVLSVLNVV